MERNGHEDSIRSVADERSHVARHCPCYRDLATVFQADRETARQVAIRHRSPGPLDARRSSQAGAANLLFGRLERHAAGPTAAIAEKLDVLPAIGAEAVNIADDRPTAGASWR